MSKIKRGDGNYKSIKSYGYQKSSCQSSMIARVIMHFAYVMRLFEGTKSAIILKPSFHDHDSDPPETLRKMRLVILEDYDLASEWAAKYIRNRIVQFKPTADKYFSLGLPTGSVFTSIISPAVFMPTNNTVAFCIAFLSS